MTAIDDLVDRLAALADESPLDELADSNETKFADRK